MSRKAFDQIKAGLEDAVAYAHGDTARGKAHKIEVVDVKAVRGQLEMTQAQFADLLHIPVATIRNWEQNRRQPEGPARVLLQIVAREPKAVRRALGA
jgi:putative transcriptional regulator